MQVQKTEKYTLIKPTETNFDTFFKSFVLDNFLKEHLIIDLLNIFEVSVTNIEQFSSLSETKKEAGYSFIIINDTIEIDAIEDETLSIVPTLLEANDTLAMDEMERDLGM